MKKLIAFLFSFNVLIFSIFSFEFPRPVQFVQTDLSYIGNRGIEQNKLVFSSEYGASWENVSLNSGIQFYADVFDFTICADWFPKKLQFDLEHSSLSLGFCGTYHFQNQFSIASENDLNFALYMKILSKNGFEFRSLLGYGFKTTDIYALPEEFGNLWDNDLVIAFFFSKEFKNKWQIYYSVKNYDMYRYYLPDNPIHTFGGSYKFDVFKIGSELELKFTDQVKSTPCLTGMWFKLFARYYF